jgi:predicted nucleic acid-binding protein
MCNPEKVYWDSSIWIALIKGENINGVDRCETPRLILEDAKAGKVLIYISRITVVEVQKKKNKPELNIVEDNSVQNDFLKHNYIKHIDVDKKVAYLARDLAFTYKLKPCDAIHLASAIKVNAEALHHWDGDFGKVPSNILNCCHPTKWTKQTSIKGDNF